MKRYMKSDEVTKWYEYLDKDVFNRLSQCTSTRGDLKPLVDAKWKFMKKQGKDKQGFTREDALISVLEHLDMNGQDDVADITKEEYEDLKYE